MLQIAVNDSETLGAMIEGIEQVAHLITRCKILESIYLRADSQSSTTEQLKEAIVKLYVSILRYLSKARQYFEQSTAKRMIIASVKSAQMSVQVYLSVICKKQARVDSCVQLIVSGQRQELNHRVQRLESLLRQLEQPIDRSAVQLSELQDHLLQSERTSILSWLSKIPYRKIHRMTGKDVLPRSGEWIWQNEEFLDWTKSSVSSILLLHGIPGSGKTKLMCNVVNRHLNSANMAPAMTAYFYCTRNPAESINSNPDEIMRSILKQLSSSRPELPIRVPVVNAFQERQRDARTDGGEVTQLDAKECLKLILAILERDPAYIFLDALDECDIFRRDELINAINTIKRESASLVKIMVSSRDEHDISCHFANSPHIQIRAQDNGNDIERFVHVSLAKAVSEKRLLNGVVSSSLWVKIAATLIERADGMFRWTSLQIQLLCNPERIRIEEDVIEELGSLPRGLKESYDVIYQQIMGLAAPSRILATRVFRWLMCAQSLLAPGELLAAVSMGTHLKSYTTANILSVCCNLVVVDDNGYFKFAHLSVREYFESLETFSSGLNHVTILQRCLDAYLRLNDPSISSTRLKDDFTIKSYAAMYWPIHYQLLAEDDFSEEVRSKVQTFLFGASGECLSYQDWINDAWNISLYSEALESTNNRHECTVAHRQKLGSMANASGSTIFLSCCFGWEWILDELAAFNSTKLICRNDKDESGLYLAAWWGHEDVLKSLLMQYDTTGPAMNDLEEALYAGVESERANIVELLVKKHASGESLTRFGESALQAAVRQEKTTILCLLLGEEISFNPGLFGKACCYAYDEGKVGALDKLLAKAASLNINQHFQLLMWVAKTEYEGLTLSLIKQRLNSAMPNARLPTTRFLEIEEPLGTTELDLGKLPKRNRREGDNLVVAFRAAASSEEMLNINPFLDFMTTFGTCWIKPPGQELHDAVKWNSEIVASVFLAFGADIEAVDDKGRTPLWLSMILENTRMALFLIDRGANVNATIDNGVTLIDACARLEHNQHQGGKILQAILSRGGILSFPHRPWLAATPLMIAASFKNYISAQVLIDYGADINGFTDTEGPPLHIATSKEIPAMVRFLLERGADPDALGHFSDFHLGEGKCTALHIAAFKGNYGIAKLLLQASADVTARFSKSWTPLHIAVSSAQKHILPLLVEHGADLEARSASDNSESNAGMTAMHLAVDSKEKAIVRRLIEMGADVNATNDEGRTPLHYALNGFVELDVIILLLKAGARYDSPDKAGITPAQVMLDGGLDGTKELIEAYMFGPEEIVEGRDQLSSVTSGGLVGILDGMDEDVEEILPFLDRETQISVPYNVGDDFDSDAKCDSYKYASEMGEHGREEVDEMFENIDHNKYVSHGQIRSGYEL